jgi:ribosome-associated protein
MRINDELAIDESEIEIQTTTSRGPGGQHVNRTETRVVLRLNVIESVSFSEEQRSIVLRKLGRRISREGILQVAAEDHRSQTRNRELARERMIELLASALHRERPRKPTRPTRASQTRRVDDKKRRGTTKQGRNKPTDD